MFDATPLGAGIVFGILFLCALYLVWMLSDDDDWWPLYATLAEGMQHRTTAEWLELLIKANGKVVGEMRHKSKGSTIRDAVENGLEDMAKDIGRSK